MELQTPYRSTMGDEKESDLNFFSSRANTKNWHTKCRSYVDQKVSPKNASEICALQRVAVAKNKKQRFVKY